MLSGSRRFFLHKTCEEFDIFNGLIVLSKYICSRLFYFMVYEHGRFLEIIHKYYHLLPQNSKCILTLLPSFSRMNGLKICQTILKMNGCLTICTSFRRSGIASWMKESKRKLKLGLKAFTCFIPSPSKSMMTTTPLIWVSGSRIAASWMR